MYTMCRAALTFYWGVKLWKPSRKRYNISHWDGNGFRNLGFATLSDGSNHTYAKRFVGRPWLAALMADLVGGMNFTAPAPDFFDMRDGVLDATPPSRDCLVWEAFAPFGMGESSSYRRRFIWYSITEDFTPPASYS